jgi:hypothetical protein
MMNGPFGHFLAGMLVGGVLLIAVLVGVLLDEMETQTCLLAGNDVSVCDVEVSNV